MKTYYRRRLKEVVLDPTIIDNCFTRSYYDTIHEDQEKTPYEWDEVLKILTPRQSEVLQLLLMGKSQSDIAVILNISRQAVSQHIIGNKGHGGLIRKIKKYDKRKSVA